MGDEGNLHSVQTIDAMMEVMETMNVKNCIMNAQKNAPMIGIVYDGITAGYLLTQDDTRVDYELYLDCLMLLTNRQGVPSLEDRLRQFGMQTVRYYVDNNGAEEEVTPEQVKTVYIVASGPNRGQTLDIPRSQLEERIRYVEPLGEERVGGRGRVAVTEEAVRETIFTPDEYQAFLERETKGGPQILPGITSRMFVLKDDPEVEVEESKEFVLADNPNVQVERRHVITGKALFSALLPPDFYYKKGDVVIVNGVLVNGIITKDHIGPAKGSIIQALWKRYGRDRTVDFLTDGPFVLSRWLTENGFSVGLKDCYPEDDSHKKLLQQELAKITTQIAALGSRLEDPIEEERREQQVREAVNIVKNLGSRISTEKLAKNNSLKIMAESGAKGSIQNIAQITGLVAQQYVKSERMPLTITNNSRCLPYFDKDDLDPRARGFCTNSFLTGLTPAELFYHQAGSREGLMDTAVKTSETGSIHHKIIKALEDIRIAYDGSVRNGVGTVFQFVYGEDGFDAGQLEPVRTRTTGEIASFIDLKQVVGQLNARHGFANAEPEQRVVQREFEATVEREYTFEDEEIEYGGDE